MKRVVIFASGSGSNAENIFNQTKEKITITGIFTNKTTAGVIDRANRLGIPVFTFTKNELNEVNSRLYKKLSSVGFDLIVLAGFLLKVPNELIKFSNNRIINIHPSLLPKYGGKGMYGNNVHRAVIENQEGESGITIHWVNGEYDEGNIICQHRTSVFPDDNIESLSSRIHELEYQYFPKTIINLLSEL